MIFQRCRKADKHEEVAVDVKGDSCGWNMKALILTTGIKTEDILYASFSSEVLYLHYHILSCQDGKDTQ